MTPQFLTTQQTQTHPSQSTSIQLHILVWKKHMLNIILLLYRERETNSNAAHNWITNKIIPQKFHTLNFFFSISCTLSYSQLTHSSIFFFFGNHNLISQYPLTNPPPKTLAFHGFHGNFRNKKFNTHNQIFSCPFECTWHQLPFSNPVAIYKIQPLSSSPSSRISSSIPSQKHFLCFNLLLQTKLYSV